MDFRTVTCQVRWTGSPQHLSTLSVDKNAVDNVSFGVQLITISPGEYRMLRATALEVLDRTLDEIARNSRVMSRGEKMMRGLKPEQLYAESANSLQSSGRWKSS